MIIELVRNSAILIALSVGYGFLSRMCRSRKLGCQLGGGALFGVIAILAMKAAVHHESGLLYDGRAVILGMAGLFGGVVSAGVSVFLAGVYRYLLGGPGVWAGELSIVTAAICGLVYRHAFQKAPHERSLLSLFMFGVVIHLIMLASQLVVMGGELAVQQLLVPVLVVFPATTMAVGFLMGNEDRRVTAQAALRQSEENFRRSLDESPMGMYIVSDEGKTIYANQAFLDIFGFKAVADFEGSQAQARYTAASYAAHQERKERRKRGEYVAPEYDIEIVRTDGELRYVRVSRNRISWDGALCSHAIYKDITERIKMVIDLQKAKEKAEESDRLKSAFLANMSHGIRTPLNVILGFSEMLTSGEGLIPGKLNEYTAIIRHHSEDLLQTMSNIINISKLETRQMQVYPGSVNLPLLLEDLRRRYFRRLAETGKRHVKLMVRTPEAPFVICTDKEKLSQIFHNLLDNAARFTVEGSIEFGITDAGDDRLHFFVSDTGPGIPGEVQEHIFDCFRAIDAMGTRDSGGIGLGLPVVKRLAELLGGEVDLQSEAGKGTKVVVCLPKERERETGRGLQGDKVAG